MSQSLATQEKTSAERPTEPGRGTRVGPYEIEGSLGAGGMGEVYRAIDTRLDRPVAIKRILPDRQDLERTRRRFRLEAQAVAALNHPAIVRVYDLVSTAGAEWLVMELIEGRPLDDLLHKGPLDIRNALRLFQSLADGLAQAHEAGILHRDLKAGNVMVTPQGRAKLLDFGLVKRLGTTLADTGLTSEGRLIGTPRAMSPEQALGEPLDVRSDLFSFGIMLYETVTGENPFYSQQALRTLHRICFHVQAPASSIHAAVPTGLSDLIDQLLEKDRKLRPSSAREVAFRLGELFLELSSDEALPATVNMGPRSAISGFAPSESRTSFLAGPTPSSSSTGQRAPASTGQRAPASTTGQSLTGERQQVTVLHCELTSAEHSQVLDPEDLIEIRPIFHRLAEQVARDHGGRLDDLLDYGFRLCFSPSPDEGRDVERALGAARSLIEGASGWEMHEALDIETPAVRIGIHSGPAVCATDETGDERLAYGDTAVVAAAVQRLGDANGILLSEASRRRLDASAPLEALQPARMPGLSRPIQAYRWTA